MNSFASWILEGGHSFFLGVSALIVFNLGVEWFLNQQESSRSTEEDDVGLSDISEPECC